MTAKRVALVVAASLVAALLGWGMMTALGRFLRTPTPDVVVDPPATTDVATPAPATTTAVPRIKATLFFASVDGQRLVGMERDVPLAEGTVAQARVLVEALLSADAPAPLSSTMPEGTALRGVYISTRNEAFVDLDPAIRTRHPGGSMQELLTVYSLVNTLLVNLPTLQEVQILIGGQEADTLAGHVDLRRPLRRNDTLIQPAEVAVPPATPPTPSPQ